MTERPVQHTFHICLPLCGDTTHAGPRKRGQWVEPKAIEYPLESKGSYCDKNQDTQRSERPLLRPIDEREYSCGEHIPVEYSVNLIYFTFNALEGLNGSITQEGTRPVEALSI